MTPYSFSACTRTYELLWQQGLRRCVRLYLALDEPGSEAPTLELALRLLEHYLRAYLLAAGPVTPDATAEAWGLLEAAQVEWLGDAARCAQLRREMSIAQALRPRPFLAPPLPYRPAIGGAWRTGQAGQGA